jgi:hypothetical protein
MCTYTVLDLAALSAKVPIERIEEAGIGPSQVDEQRAFGRSRREVPRRPDKAGHYCTEARDKVL